MTKSLLLLFCCLSLGNLVAQDFKCFDLKYEIELQFDLLPEKPIYFMGETHNIASNDLLDFHLLKYLNKKYGIKTFIKEGSCSYNYFLNEYTQTGNEQLLDTLVNTLGHYVVEQREFLRQIKDLNSVLGREEQISIYSIDAESFFHTSSLIKYWKEKWGHPINKDVSFVFQTLENFKASSLSYFPIKKDKKRIDEIISTVQPVFSSNEAEFKDYLKEDFVHLKMIVENHATNDRTEKNLAANFMKLHNLIDRNSGYFFSYGKLHAQKKKGWLADQVNRSEEFENSVVTIKPFYKNSSIYWKGSSVKLNDYDELSENQRLGISTLSCEKDWLMLEIEDDAFDFYIISNNQTGITLERIK